MKAATVSPDAKHTDSKPFERQWKIIMVFLAARCSNFQKKIVLIPINYLTAIKIDANPGLA